MFITATKLRYLFAFQEKLFSISKLASIGCHIFRIALYFGKEGWGRVVLIREGRISFRCDELPYV